MNMLLNVILIVGPLLLGTYLAVSSIVEGTARIVAWVFCLFLCFCGAYRVIKQKKEEDKETQAKEYYRQSHERRELYIKGLPIPYVNGLGENPLLKHSFNEGQSYEEESKFKEAIGAYKRCLCHPNATEENKVAANILVGSCYYMLSKLKEAEKYYKEALDMSKRVKNEDERLRGRSCALSGIGVIYKNLGKSDEAIKYHREALEIHKKIGYGQGIASDLGNIGILYKNLGKPDEALKYHKEALEVFKCIGAQRQMKIILKNIDIIEEEKKKSIQ